MVTKDILEFVLDLTEECFYVNVECSTPHIPAQLYRATTERFVANLQFQEIATLPFFKTIRC